MFRVAMAGAVLVALCSCSGASVSKCPTPQVVVSQLSVPVDRRWAGSDAVVDASGDSSSVRWTFKVSGLPSGVVASGAGTTVTGLSSSAISFNPAVDDALGASLDAVPGTYAVTVSTAPIDGDAASCDPAGVASVTVTLVVEDRPVECVTTAGCQTRDAAQVDNATQAALYCATTSDCPQTGDSWCVSPGAGTSVCVFDAPGCTPPLVEVTRTSVEGHSFLSCDDPTPTSSCNARGHCVCNSGVRFSGSCR